MSMVSIYAGAAMPALAMLALLFNLARGRWWVPFVSLLSLALSALCYADGSRLGHPAAVLRHAAILRYLPSSPSGDPAVAIKHAVARPGDRIRRRFAVAAAIVGATPSTF
jgi:hypothetical protein